MKRLALLHQHSIRNLRWEIETLRAHLSRYDARPNRPLIRMQRAHKETGDDGN